jgi:hypothetical protein
MYKERLVIVLKSTDVSLHRVRLCLRLADCLLNGNGKNTVTSSSACSLENCSEPNLLAITGKRDKVVRVAMTLLCVS